LDQYWQLWNTSDSANGTYSTYVGVMDENNITSTNKDGTTTESGYNFTIS